ncbi:UbiA family prenyltransferase [Embleya sp. NBC_00896]|uniref:UbiA family prenyltransferase n=1 Tax=Embleya sp. NBC_00896 TaxID=2975961 RepID=UPI00386BEE3B|nr:UbiA family prenyltransferase [Embleya sp. NBC_00896]
MNGPDRAPTVGLLLACHPGPTVAVTALVTALAAAAGRDAKGCALVGAAVLSGQLSVGWCNDAVDAARDRAGGRTGKPVVAGLVGAERVARAARYALVACVPLSYAHGPAAGTVHVVGVGAAWAYDLGVKGTLASWVPYAVGFGSLPAFVAFGLPGRPSPTWWIVAAAALLGCGAHLADALPDLADDLAAGVRGLPHRLGPTGIRTLTPLPLVGATALLAYGRPDRAGRLALGAAGLVGAAGALLGGRRPRVPFAAAVAVAAIDVALLLRRGTGIARQRSRQTPRSSRQCA